MAASTLPAYYLMVTGGSLSIISAVTLLRVQFMYYSVNEQYLFLIPLLLGIATIYFGQGFYTKPASQFKYALAGAAASIATVFFFPSSGIYYIGLFFAGPPLSFAGGMLGLLLSRASEQSSKRQNQ